MHVFIDTNILLNFFHFSKDELDALSNVFASHANGAAVVHLTEQVCDEFRRNRESKIKDALRRFNEAKFIAQLPSFMKAYEEHAKIQSLSSDLQALAKAILDKANEDIAAKRLMADALINEVFDRAKVIPTTHEIFTEANMRVAVGKPPGKPGSIGDAINWTVLLQEVPDKEPLHVISEDGDFYSALDHDMALPYLADEWRARKGSDLRMYRTLTAFLNEHFDGVAFSFDRIKDELIDELASTGAFVVTHQLIAKLEAYRYFSLKEVERILTAAQRNSQFGWIITDYDVSDFLNRIAVPRLSEVSDEHRAILQKVVEEQRSRAALEL